MRKTSIIIGICLSIPTFQAFSADSTIKVKGQVLEFGCAVSSESAEFTVDLLKHSSKQFPIIGSTSNTVPFSIILADCGEGTTQVKVAFSGTSDSSNNALLQLDSGSNSAQGVGVEIMDSSRMPLPINGSPSSLKWINLPAEQTITLPFYARLMSTQPQVKPGQVRATATFTLEFQ